MRVIATLLLWGMCCLGAQASSITYKTPGGSKDTAGEPVNAAVTFTTGPGFVMIELSNLQPNPKSDGQSLSDLLFNMSNGTVAGASFGASSAAAITINSGGITTAPTALTTAADIGWVLSEPTPTEFVFDVLSGPGHAGPAHTIIGPPGSGGVYSNANGSIAGSGSHNPFISEVATWTISDPNISSGTKIIAETFSFGTLDMGDTTTGIPAVPTTEPSSMLLMGSGLLVFGEVLRRKLSKRGNGYSQARS